MKQRMLLFLLVGVVVMVGCMKESVPDGGMASGGATFEISGVVTHVALEGGFFAVVGEGGETFDPVNLPEGFQREGLAVQVTARKLEGAMGIHMHGVLIEIVEIQKR